VYYFVEHVHSPTQATDNRVDEKTLLLASFPSGNFSFPFRNKFKGKLASIWMYSMTVWLNMY